MMYEIAFNILHALHVEPPHLHREGAALAFEESVLALPVQRVCILQHVEPQEAAVQIEQSFGQSFHHLLHQPRRLV